MVHFVFAVQTHIKWDMPDQLHSNCTRAYIYLRTALFTEGRERMIFFSLFAYTHIKFLINVRLFGEKESVYLYVRPLSSMCFYGKNLHDLLFDMEYHTTYNCEIDTDLESLISQNMYGSQIHIAC